MTDVKKTIGTHRSGDEPERIRRSLEHLAEFMAKNKVDCFVLIAGDSVSGNFFLHTIGDYPVVHEAVVTAFGHLHDVDLNG